MVKSIKSSRSARGPPRPRPRPPPSLRPPSAARKPAPPAGAKSPAGAKQGGAEIRRSRAGQMGLCIRWRQGGGQVAPARSARRQGRQPRRDGQSRPAGTAGIHHHHRGLHLLLRSRQNLSERAQRPGRSRAGCGRQDRRPAVRRPRQPAAGLGAIGRARLDAGHDGHRAQSRPQRHHRRGAGRKLRRPPLRLRFLPALHHHVFERGARPRTSSVRGDPR